jgi:hydrogenase maturation factor HypE
MGARFSCGSDRAIAVVASRPTKRLSDIRIADDPDLAPIDAGRVMMA